MNFDFAALTEKVKMLGAALEKIWTRVERLIYLFELMERLGVDAKSFTVPVVVDPLIERGEVCKILKIGSAACKTLIERKQLTPLYIADSSAAKFRLSEVNKIIEEAEKCSRD